MEGDRNAYTEESGIKLAKQRRVISTLSKEKNALLNDYKITMRDTNKRKDQINVTAINYLLDEQEKVINRIKNTKSQMSEIEFQINKVEILFYQLIKSFILFCFFFRLKSK